MTASKIVMNAASGVGGGGGPYSIKDAELISETNRVFIQFEADGTVINGHRGMFFGDNGTKIYVCAYSQHKLHRWDLSTAYDLNTAEYNSGQVFGTDDITGVFLKSDGTKLYLSNLSSNQVKEYDLSTAWDITTGTLSHTLDVSSQTTDPQGLFFKPDGTEMYLVDKSTDSVEQFTLSTGWDLSTATWTRARSVAEETAPYAVVFKSDGTKMYILGTGDDAINEYTLSTAWNISTETHTRLGSDLHNNCTALAINDDGTKFYVLDTARYAILEYEAPTAYSVANLSLNGIKSENFLDVVEVLRDAGQTIEPNIRSATFSADGTKLYITGTTTDSIIEFSLSTAYDLSTASYSEKLSVNTNSGNPYNLAISDDGTEMIIADQSTIDQYTFSTGFSLSSQTGFNTKDVSSESYNLVGCQFLDNGTKGYFMCNNRKSPVIFSLSTGWDVTTASFPVPNGLNVASEEANVNGVALNGDGTKLYVVGYGGDDLNRYSLSTAYDVSTATLDWTSTSFSSIDGVVRGIWVNSDGTQLWMMGNATDVFIKHTITSTGITGGTSYSSPAPDDTSPVGIFYKPNGNELYYNGWGDTKVYQWTLTTAFDPSTKTGTTKELDVSSKMNSPKGVFLDSTGTILLVSGASVADGGGIVAKYTLSTAWDISTATFSQEARLYCNGYDLWAKADGTKIFTTDNSIEQILQYDLTTAWDLSTLSDPATSTQSYLGQVVREISGASTTALGIAVSEDADILLYPDMNSDYIYEFSMGTAHDLSTLTYTGNNLALRPFSSVSSISYNNDGTKLYAACYQTDTIVVYQLA